VAVASVDGASSTRIRANRWRIFGYPAVALAFGVGCWIFGPANPNWYALIALNFAIAAAGGVERWGYGITLTDTQGLVHHGRGKSTSVRWTRIQAITVESVGGRKRIALWTDDRRQILLDEPRRFITGGGHFDRSFRVIDEWWRSHRGAAWTPTLQIDL
jgi:hypothetical protein